MSKLRKLPLLLGITFLLVCAQARAWSAFGHEVICEIAYQHLHDAARRELRRLAASDPEKGFRTLRRGCSWPDFVRERFPERAAEHYVNLPRSWPEIRAAGCPLAERCLFSAIDSDLATVANRGVSDARRWQALKFLGHWVGDIHQPLHVSHADDRGGGDIRVDGDPPCRNTLHAYWDDCLVQAARKLRVDRGASRDHAQALISVYAGGGLATESGGQAIEWANESFSLLREPALGYCQLVGNSCWYDERRQRFARDGGGHAAQRRVIALAPDYQEIYAPLVEARLYLAGIRLAKLLNRVLPAQDPSVNKP